MIPTSQEDRTTDVVGSKQITVEEPGSNKDGTVATRKGVVLAGEKFYSTRSSLYLQDDTTETDALVYDNNYYKDILAVPVDNLSVDEKAKYDKAERAELLDDEQVSFARIKDGHVESKLSEDSTSFIITSPINTSPFAVGVIVSAMKIVVFTLAFVNAWQQPSAIALSAGVAVTQFLALIFAAATQDDIVVCVKYIYEGYKALDGNFDGGVKRGKWALAVLASFFEGLFGLATIWVLTTKSRTVLDVLLNFAAVSFVAKLDSAAFWLSSLGFFGSKCKTESEKVVVTYFRVGHSQKFGYAMKVALLVGTFTAMLIPWIVVIAFQKQGRNVPSLMVAQFDDEANASLAAYSGVYKFVATDSSAFSPDPFRWEKSFSNDIKGKFGYCKGRWTFFFGKNPCEEQVVTSTETEKYDVLKAAAGDWFVNVSSRSLLMEHFTMVPVCQKEGIHSCGPNGSCVISGRNKAMGRCKCSDAETYGTRCQYSVKESTCRQLEIDDQFGILPATRRLATKFDLLLKNGVDSKREELNKTNLVILYGHPVYVGDSTRGQKGVDVLFYTGLRWAITNSVDGFVDFKFDGTKKSDVTDLVVFLNRKKFHSNSKVKKVDIVSERVMFQSQEDTAAPIEISWVPLVASTKLSEVQLLETLGAERLLCADCDDETNKCQYEGRCNTTTKQCECRNGAGGVLCQIPPIGNEHCDEFFNNPAFQYDGGDCCEDTCRANTESPFICGTILTDSNTVNRSNTPFADTSISNYIGFANCSDPAIVFDEDCAKSECWAKLELGLGKDEIKFVYLSSNGRIMLVYQPLLENLSVYDRTLSFGWVKRSGNILGMYGHDLISLARYSDFGILIRFSTLPVQVFGATKEFPFWLVFIVGTPSGKTTAIFVGWDYQSVSWKRFAQDLDLEFESYERGFDSDIDEIRMDVRPSGKQGVDIRFVARGNNDTSLYVYEVNGTSTTNQQQLIEKYAQQEELPFNSKDWELDDSIRMNTAVAVGVWSCELTNDSELHVFDMQSGDWSGVKVEDICDGGKLRKVALDELSTRLSVTLILFCQLEYENTSEGFIKKVHLVRELTATGVEYDLRAESSHRLPLIANKNIAVLLSPSHLVLTYEDYYQQQTMVFAYDKNELFQLGNTLYDVEVMSHSLDLTSLAVRKVDSDAVDVFTLHSSCNPNNKTAGIILSIATGFLANSTSWNVTIYSSNQEPRRNVEKLIPTRESGLAGRTILREEICVDLIDLRGITINVAEDSVFGCRFVLTMNGVSLSDEAFFCNHELSLTKDNARRKLIVEN